MEAGRGVLQEVDKVSLLQGEPRWRCWSSRSTGAALCPMRRCEQAGGDGELRGAHGSWEGIAHL